MSLRASDVEWLLEMVADAASRVRDTLRYLGWKSWPAAQGQVDSIGISQADGPWDHSSCICEVYYSFAIEGTTYSGSAFFKCKSKYDCDDWYDCSCPRQSESFPIARALNIFYKAGDPSISRADVST